ncbi:MAG: hypothetical protein FIA99_12320 [Ruminiclostridium sp.]|nr:hypothetical protein [Ruminiclostridium sp.]
MKKTQKILGLPIISISDGMEVGKVKSIIINAEKGAIDYIIVDSGIQIFSARVIPNDDVLGIGEYALTIENEGVITDINRIPAAIQLLQKDIHVKGTKVLTKKGRLIGEIGDIYIDDGDNCTITGLEFIADITQKKVRIIPRDSVITFGKNLTVVKEDIESFLLDTPLQLASDDRLSESEKKNDINIEEYYSIPNTDSYISSDGESAYKEASVEVPSAGDSAVAPESDADNNAAILFEQRQRQYLKGRRATKTIADSSGSIIISDGMLIDDQVIDEAKLKGKLIELVMNNKA